MSNNIDLYLSSKLSEQSVWVVASDLSLSPEQFHAEVTSWRNGIGITQGTVVDVMRESESSASLIDRVRIRLHKPAGQS